MSEWPSVPLSECADFINGRAFKPSDFSDEGVPVIRIKQLLDPAVTPDLFAGDLGERHRLRDGDLVFSWSGTLAVRIWDRGAAALNQHLFRVVERPGVVRLWLRYAIESKLPELSGMSHGTTMRHITKKSLDECRVALPPVTDQLRIADLLATIDATIADEKEGLARAQGLVIAFRENRIGAESRIIKLGDVLQQIGVGESPRCLDRLPNVGEWGVLKVSAVRQAHFDRTQVKALPPSTPPKLAAQFESGDLLMTRSNTLERVGMACIARGDVSQLLLSDLIFRMRLDEERLLPEYAAHALSTRAVRDQIERAAVGTSGSMKKVNQGIIRSLEVAAPVIAEQRQFLKAISALESVVDAYGRAIEQHLELKRAVLASLTSGLHRIPKSYDRFLTDEDPDAITPEPATA